MAGRVFLRAALYATVSAGVIVLASPSSAVTLKEAIATALHSNPEIGQAIENREAIEFELRQAKGLYLPSVDLEASTGVRRLDNTSRRALDIEDDTLNEAGVDLVVTQKLLDFGGRRAEVDRQASRVDGASFRVLERSEVIALAVVQDYLEYLLQVKIVADTAQNVRFHQGIMGEIREGVQGGALTDADLQQAQERLYAAQARATEALGELEEAKIRFFKTVGIPLADPSMPKSVASLLPGSLDTAIGWARENSPRIKAALSDIDAASADVRRYRQYFWIVYRGPRPIGSAADTLVRFAQLFKSSFTTRPATWVWACAFAGRLSRLMTESSEPTTTHHMGERAFSSPCPSPMRFRGTRDRERRTLSRRAMFHASDKGNVALKIPC